MPKIEITGHSDYDKCNVLPIMYFPKDELKRKQFHLLNQTNEMLKSPLKQFVLGRDDLELLLEAPSYDDFKKVTADAVKKGVIAGDVITCIYLMQLFEIAEPSFNKAIHIMKEFALDHEIKYGDETSLPRSEQTIRNCWNEFAPVAHFWGAFRINQAYPFSDKFEIFENENFDMFLEIAAGILRFGKEFVPFRTKDNTALLDGDIWELPNTITPRKLVNGELPDLMVKFLEKYKAPITN